MTDREPTSVEAPDVLSHPDAQYQPFPSYEEWRMGSAASMGDDWEVTFREFEEARD
jgi:hypothetical protein